MDLIHLLIYIMIIAVVFSLVWWAITQIPLPEPMGMVLRVVVAVIGCLVLITVLLNLAGMGGALHL